MVTLDLKDLKELNDRDRDLLRNHFGMSPGPTRGGGAFWDRWGGIIIWMVGTIGAITVTTAIFYGDIRVMRSQLDDLRQDMREIKHWMAAEHPRRDPK